ncbi:MAG: type II toxin-antitoxin system HicB family antitoxin [Candidatus Micrarchaeota archaeon]|nr:type II toxin-antitoxin system HicB family antitoxin [Candidatus Micrarchaeota archaeon]
MEKNIKLSAIMHKEDDMYIAECPEVGTVSQGETIEKAIENLKEATELYLEEFTLKTQSPAIMTTFEVAAYAKNTKKSTGTPSY